MDRCVVFVDAGYLLAAGGTLCLDTKNRAGLVCNYKSLVEALTSFALEHDKVTVLRTYWYDGAKNAVPTPDHLRVAELPNVKLRLGRISGGEQKGVDSLIVRDFMTLARERAMVTAYLLAGDEDLREGVVAAQDMGVRVVVEGIPTTLDNQARTLIREADEHVMLPKDFWLPHFSKLQAASPLVLTSDGLTSETGTALADDWFGRATPDESKELLKQRPRLPKELDVQLIEQAEKRLGSLRDRQDLKRGFRQAFWARLDELVRSIP
jgi:hypothetical protein